MSSIKDKYGAAVDSIQQGAGMGGPVGPSPGWMSDPNGVPFSRRNTPDLYSAWLATSQESPGALLTVLKGAKSVPQRLKDVFEINIIPQQKRDGLFAGMYSSETAEIEADKNVNILKARMKCYPDDAHNPIVTNFESQRREQYKYYRSRNQVNSPHNERLLVADSQNKMKTEGEVRHIFPEEPAKRGAIGRLLHGGK